MTTRRLFIAAVILTVSASAFAALSPQHDAWGKSAVKFLMTDEETAAWKNVKTDEEAQAFINLFWARRDPTPATPANEFRATIEERIRYADEKFVPMRKKVAGSLTDRGMMLIVFGSPQRRAAENATAQLGAGASAGRVSAGTNTTGTPDLRSATDDRRNSYEIWTYEGENTRNLFGIPRAQFTFVDKTNTQEFVVERGGHVDVAAARKRAAAANITQPQLTKAPEFTSVPMAGAAITPATATVTPAPMAAPVVTTLTTPALAASVAEVRAAKTNPYAKAAYATWGEYVTANGDYFVPVMLYVPKASAAAASEDVTFFGVVEDANGNSVLAFEQPAKLTASKNEFFVDRSLTALPAGKHRGYFGLAANGKTVAMVPVEMTLAGSLDKSTAGISQLILSNNIYPLTEPQRPTDPFAFGGTKVVPKADKTFSASSDELWYFFELRNPGIAETGGPKVQVKIDITGKLPDGTPVKKSAPLSEAHVMELKGVTGHYAVGSAFPLATFKPGDYNIAVKVIDTVSKASYTLSDTFKIVQ